MKIYDIYQKLAQKLYNCSIEEVLKENKKKFNKLQQEFIKSL